MRYRSLIVAVLALPLLARAQEKTAVPHPLAYWIPPGWTLLDSAQGDLNGDGRTDRVLALESPKTRTLSEEGAGTYTVHPRRLLLLFGAEGGYTCYYSSDRLIPYKYGSWEPMEDIRVPAAGQLLLSFAHQYPNDTEWGEHVTYRFRREGGRFRLIGAEYQGNTGKVWDYVEYSYNFLTGRRSRQRTAVTEEGDETKGKEEWARFPAAKAIYLDQWKGPFTIPMKQDFIAL